MLEPVSETCPECSKPLDLDNSPVCHNCGLVLEDRPIDYSHPPRRIYNIEEIKERVQNGKPKSVFDVDMTYMTWINPNEAKLPKYNGFYRIAKRDLLKRDYKKAKLIEYGKQLKVIAKRLRVPYPYTEQAFVMFRKLYKNGFLKGRGVENVSAICLFIVSKENGTILQISNICSEINCSKKHFFQVYQKALQELTFKQEQSDILIYIEKCVNLLHLNYLFVKKIAKIHQKLPKNFTVGKNPYGIIGAIIYRLLKQRGRIRVRKYGRTNQTQKYTQQTIAEKLGITTVTLRVQYKQILGML